MSEKSEKIWQKAARTIVKAGYIPFPLNDTLLELLKILMTEEQANFIHQVFKKSSLRMDQIKERTDLDDASIMRLLNDLMDGGIVVGSFSRTTGDDIYRLMGPFPGIFEYTFMRGGTTEKEKKLVVLFDKMFNEMAEVVQKNYDVVAKMSKDSPPISRVVPVEEFIEVGQEEVIPREELSKILEDYDIFAKTHCYCRHEKNLLNEPCKVTDEVYNCLLLDKSANYAIEHKFGEKISKEEAQKILAEAEDYGLVHKIFHVHLNPEREIEGICSCCKCCCGILGMYYRGMGPLHTITSYLAKISEDDCIGCGTCVEKCPMECFSVLDSVAVINEEKCIGCGVCAHHCPEKAIKLERTGSREVFLPPVKIS